MYPAGRIMHLVPARLVPGTAAHLAAAAAAAAAAAQGEQEAVGLDGLAASGDAAADGAAGQPSRPKHAARLSVSDLIAGEEMISPRSAAAAGWVEPPHSDGAAGLPAAGAAAAEPQQQQPPQEQMVLLDGVPQEAYGRIKLCRQALRTMCCPGWGREGRERRGPLGGLSSEKGRPIFWLRLLCRRLAAFHLFANAFAPVPLTTATERRSATLVAASVLPLPLPLLDLAHAARCAVLCRTVLSDHIIPNYLRALESALENMQQHAAEAGAKPGTHAHPLPAGSTEAAAAGNAPTLLASAAAAAAVPAGTAAAAVQGGGRSGKQD